MTDTDGAPGSRTLTRAQATAAAPSTAIADYLAATTTNATTLGPIAYSAATVDGSRLVGTTSGGFVDYAIASGSGAQGLRSTPSKNDFTLFLRLENDNPKLGLTREVCEPEVVNPYDTLLDDARQFLDDSNGAATEFSQGVVNRVRDQVSSWCSMLAGH